jgi:hypothetical protein
MPGGGVCAVLDYDVELKADYVSEMATRIVMPQNSVDGRFRKFVSQILTSTRLPSTTILLGMNYLSKRVNMMRNAGQQTHSEGQVWRMVTVALMLGSKFLDDNTFQNKSWSEVSNISVQELNTLENEWLYSINWTLYVNLDESKDYQAWLANWQEWLENKKRLAAQAVRDRRVPPINTDIAGNYYSWHQQQVAFEQLASAKRNLTPPMSSRYGRDSAISLNARWQQPSAPLTPPDSGYGTPVYQNATVNPHYLDRAMVGVDNAGHQYTTPPYSAYPHVAHQPGHPNGYGSYSYGHGIWDHPATADCRCANCLSAHAKRAAYFSSPVYGLPSVGCLSAHKQSGYFHSPSHGLPVVG